MVDVKKHHPQSAFGVLELTVLSADRSGEIRHLNERAKTTRNAYSPEKIQDKYTTLLTL